MRPAGQVCIALVLTSLLSSCSRHAGQSTDSTASPAGAVAGRLGSTPPDEQALGQWTMAPGDYANTRYSPLDRINASNIATMKVAWTFSTGLNAGHEAAPLVIGTTMYVVTPFPNTVYASISRNPVRP